MFVHDLTLLLATAVTALIGCITLAWAALLGKDRQAVLMLAGAYLLLMVVALSDFSFPDPAEGVVARALIINSAHLLAAALMLAGILRFFGIRKVPNALIVTVLVVLAGNACLTLVYPDRGLRLLLFNASFAGLRLATTWVLFRETVPRDQRVARGLGVVMLMEGLAAAWRATHAHFGTIPLIGADLLATQGLLWVILLVSTAASAPMLLLMALSRVVTDHERTAARLRNTLEALPDVVLEVGPDGRYVSFHANASGLQPASSEAIVGRTIEDAFPAHVVRAQRRALDEVDRFGRASGIAYPLDVAGATRWFEITAASREADDPSTPQGYVLVIRDITERRRAQEALQYRTTLFGHLFERSPIALVLSHHQSGRIIEVNPVFLQMIGMSTEQIRARTTRAFIASGDLGTFEALHTKLQTTGNCGPSELTLVNDKGQGTPVRVSALAVVDPQHELLVWTIIEDLTERNRIERLKGEFLSLVSHELRTPLTSITGALELLAVPRIVDDPVSRAQMLDIARCNGQRLRVLIDDLLDMDTLLAGKMRFDTRAQPLLPLLQSAIDAIRPFSDQREVTLEASSAARDLCAVVDAGRLQQIMTNLLSNALKFSPQNSPIVVSLNCSDEVVRISVRDQGPGVPELFRPSLFDKFTQAESGNTRLNGGSGLGLAIVRELVLHMGGQVGYEPAHQGGALFFVELPISRESTFAAA